MHCCTEAFGFFNWTESHVESAVESGVFSRNDADEYICRYLRAIRDHDLNQAATFFITLGIRASEK